MKAAIAMLTLVLTVSAADAQVCGDVNNSGKVTTGDALAVLKSAVGQDVALQCPSAGGTPLRTGQISCWDPSNTSNPPEVPCSATGQDGETRTGLAPSFTDNGDGTITDTQTGLMWEKLDDSNLEGLAGIHDFDRYFTWPEAFVKVSDLNGIEFAGYSDWRLPNIRELETLKDYGHDVPSYSPTVWSAFDRDCVPDCLKCSCTRVNIYWSSTTVQETPHRAYYLDFSETETTGKTFKAGASFVRAVRGGSLALNVP